MFHNPAWLSDLQKEQLIWLVCPFIPRKHKNLNLALVSDRKCYIDNVITRVKLHLAKVSQNTDLVIEYGMTTTTSSPTTTKTRWNSVRIPSCTMLTGWHPDMTTRSVQTLYFASEIYYSIWHNFEPGWSPERFDYMFLSWQFIISIDLTGFLFDFHVIWLMRRFVRVKMINDVP